MSAADHEFIESVAERTSQMTVARMLMAAEDREKVAKVVRVWGDEIDRTIGRAVRQALFWVLGAASVAAAVKLGALETIAGWLKR